jgi:hypothetical protein
MQAIAQTSDAQRKAAQDIPRCAPLMPLDAQLVTLPDLM